VAALVLAAALAAQAHAATWTIGTAAGYPGDAANITVSIRGDGATSAAEVDLTFDEVQLSLPVDSGQIPNAGRAGSCGRTGSGRVTAVVQGSGTAPLASSDTVVCVIPFRIQTNATPGARVPLGPLHAECGSSSGVLQVCSVSVGWVDVLGSTAPSGGQSLQPYETNTVAILLRAPNDAPATELVVSHDYRHAPAQAPVQSLRQVPPRRVRPPHPYFPRGDYLARLQREPNSPEARLERYVYADFDSRGERESALRLLKGDPAVETAYVVIATPINGAGSQPGPKAVASAKAAITTQDHLDTFNLPAAWNQAGGWGLVGVLDNGIAPNHVELRSFTGANSIGGNFVVGGNYLPYFSRNVGGRGAPTNLDEAQSNPYEAGEEACDGDGDGLLSYSPAGHATHVSGLIAANGLDGAGLRGNCVRCGIAAVRISRLVCKSSIVVPETRPDLKTDGMTFLAQHGAQVFNMSYGSTEGLNFADCQSGPLTSECDGLSLAWQQDIVMAAAAGNDRMGLLDFPARDPRVASIGGIDDNGTFWDRAVAGETRFCPNWPNLSECGSQWAPDLQGTMRQEGVAHAATVRSTFYPGKTWNSSCGDGLPASDSAPSDGNGMCTGTSMSAPQYAGLFGLLRSINPLLRAGDPVEKATPLSPLGIRDLVALTASRGGVEDVKLGFGVPDANAAVAAILGTVRNEPVGNRVTPLFGLYSAGNRDYAAVATPQLAMALVLYSTNAYAGSGAAIPGYSAFPNTAAGAPKARALVLTTEAPTYVRTPARTPLYLLEKKRTGATPCDAVNDPRCYGDFILLTSTTQVEAAAAAGYAYGGLQGYVYQRCTPEPTCLPAGTQKLYLQCNTAIQDCAVFLEHERTSFEVSGYTAALLGGDPVLGYAYPVVDTDLDSLPDGFEYVIGTSPTNSDSDGDGVALSDAIEYPFAGLPVSDPCAGPNLTCLRGFDDVFRSGFEGQP
jgi:hypothetical protein